MHDDTELLRQYVEDGSQPAFRELVERHIQLVNATARRKAAGDAHLAQDVTQLVFTDLARKAATLPRGVVLPGWLHRHTCFLTAKAIRSETRRRARERTAMEMNILHDNPGYDAHWEQLAPVLDDALDLLAAEDRDAIVLRYLQQQDLRTVGRALGTNEDTAQKRVSRALEKLRGFLVRGGATVGSATLLSSALDAATLAPVPAGLAATVSANALSTVAVGTGATLLSLKTMLTSKLALGLAATIVVTGTTVALIAQNKTDPVPAAPSTQVAQSSKPSATPVPVKISVPQIVTTSKIEAPKAAPAPAGNKPATPDELAAIAASTPTNIKAMLGAVLSSTKVGANSNIKLTSDTGEPHTGSTFSDGTNVTYTIDGVSHTIPADTALMVNDPQTNGMVSISPGIISISGNAHSVNFATNASGSTSSMNRTMKIVNGQMITTTTKDGVTTTTTAPAPAPGTSMTDSSGAGTRMMTIVDQNGVSHIVSMPNMNGAPGTATVMFMANPDDSNSNAAIQIAPAPAPDPANP